MAFETKDKAKKYLLSKGFYAVGDLWQHNTSQCRAYITKCAPLYFVEIYHSIECLEPEDWERLYGKKIH